MSFSKPLPEWNKVGSIPPQSKKDGGWGTDEKPPADWFNWFFNTTFQALQELQQNAVHSSEMPTLDYVPNSQKGVASGVATLDSAGKVPSTQLDSTKVPFSSTNFTSTNIKAALDELFTSASNGKNSVASAITGMGQTASGADTYATLSSKISAISTDANAVSGDMLSGKTAYSGGNKKTGTMANNGAVTITPSTADQTIAAGYHNGVGKVIGDPDLIASNILSGKDIFGVVGNVVKSQFATGTITQSTNTTDNQVWTISGLSFTPKVVIVKYRESSYSLDYISFASDQYSFGGWTRNPPGWWGEGYGGGVSIGTNGFTVMTPGSGKYMQPGTLTWYAWL